MTQKEFAEWIEVNRKLIAAETTIEAISECDGLPKNVVKLIEIYREETKQGAQN